MSQPPANGHVFFDLDGTLTDSQPGITRCIEHALSALHREVPAAAELRDWIGPPLQDSFSDYLGSAALALRALALYRERFARVGLFENALYEGIDAVLGDLRAKGRSLYVVTSKPQIFAERIVSHFGLTSVFEAVYGSELDGSNGDKGTLIAHALRKEALDPGQVTMVGDRSHDIVGARENSLRSVGVLWGFGSRGELGDAGASAICEAVSELPRCL